jgi:hypothetical protein
MYDAMALSLIMLLLAGAILICIATTATLLLMNRSNVLEILPIVTKGTKISVGLSGIAGILEIVSPGSVIQDITIVVTTGILFVWSLALIQLLKARGRTLLNKRAGPDI